MKIKKEHKGIEMELTYEDDGRFSYATNLSTGKKMMVESAISGVGYEIKRDNYLMPMDVCDGRYVRIMDANLFIPRLLFIENTLTHE